MPRRIRVMTYNVHRCVGVDGRDSAREIAEVCAEARPDVLALQELDAPETDEAEGAHHARDLAKRLGMDLRFCPTFRRGVGYYGHALLSRFPFELHKVTTFAPLPTRRGAASEPRGAIWAKVHVERVVVQVVSTHLGVTRAERRAQSIELLGQDWLGSPSFASPCIVCGDLNAVPLAATYRRMAARLVDAQRALAGHRPRPTFPSRWPLARLDHVFVSADLKVRGVAVPDDRRARAASDHLPLVVDLELP